MFGSFRDADISPVASRPPGFFVFLRNVGRYPACGFPVAQAGLHATMLRSAILTGRTVLGPDGRLLQAAAGLAGYVAVAFGRGCVQKLW